LERYLESLGYFVENYTIDIVSYKTSECYLKSTYPVTFVGIKLTLLNLTLDSTMAFIGS